MSSRIRIILLVWWIFWVITWYTVILSYYLSQQSWWTESVWVESIITWWVNSPEENNLKSWNILLWWSWEKWISWISVQTSYVSLVMPGWMMTTDLQQLFDRLKQTRNIVVSVSTFFDMNEYQKTIATYSASWASGVDILLVPTMRRDSIAPFTYQLKFPESLTPYMHPLWQTFTDDANYTMVPWWLDPLVTYIRPEISIQQDPLMVSDLMSAVLIAPSLRTNSTTRLRGMSPSDAASMSNNRSRDVMRSRISYILIRQLMDTNQTDMIGQIIDIAQLSVLWWWNTTNVVKLAHTLSAKQPWCSIDRLLCLMRFGYGGILIAPLSDIERQDRLFMWVGTSLRDMQIWPWPRSSAPDIAQQPVIGRWWVVHSWSSNITGSLMVLNRLISETIRGTWVYYNHLIPASTHSYPWILDNPLYYRIKLQQPLRRMIRGTLNNPSARAREQSLVDRWK